MRSVSKGRQTIGLDETTSRFCLSREEQMGAHTLMQRAQVAVCVMLAVFFMSSTGWATTYYVNAATGNDTNAGTSATAAWKTLQKAANTLGAGDTALVLTGTYAERVQVTKSGSAAAPQGNRPADGQGVGRA